MSAHDIVARLDHCRQVSSDSWMARCPSHDDRGPSLSIKDVGDGRTLIHCFAGCGANEVLDALGMDYSDLYPPQDRHQYAAERRHRERAVDELAVEIAMADMRKGKTLSEADKQRAREALYRMDNDIASPEA